MAKKNIYPVLPLRDIVVYPKMIVPLFVGREKSIRALQEVVDQDQNIILLTQKEAAIEDPTENDVYHVGTVGTVLQMLKLPDGTVKVLIEGMERVKISKFIDNPDYMEVEAEILSDAEDNSTELEALVRAVLSQFEEYVKLSKKTPPEVLVSVNQIEDNSKLADTIASHLALKIADKQALLEGRTLKERFEKILGFMDAEITLLEVENKIKTRVKKQMEKSQKEYYLNEQMKAIQKELGDNDEEGEISDYMAKIEKAKLSKEAKEKALAEVKKLKNMSGMSSEATVIRNYLDWLLDIPWKKRSKVNKDISKAMEVLEKDLYGLEKVKERVLEYLAVRQNTKGKNGTILCFAGPPGVGKTTLAQIIANKLETPFYTLSAVTSGVKDVRDVIDRAKNNRFFSQANPILFNDEIHRFSKSQQDSLLGAVEQGIVTLIGATTENPSFEVIRPLLSRCQIYVLKSLEKEDLLELLQRALTTDHILRERHIELKETTAMLRYSGGDARKLLNILELVVESETDDTVVITDDMVTERLQQNPLAYDKDGEMHYDIISAFIKSLRGSDPDGAIYWLARMVEGGEDPAFIARRLVISASEDIGLANPNALLLANACFDAVMKVGWPEGRIPLAETTIYLATSPKSNSAYMAINDALELVRQTGNLHVPLHLRNAPT